jgi:hypothetical protein
MKFYFILFNFIHLLSSLDLLDKNIILDVNYFKEFVISEDFNYFKEFVISDFDEHGPINNPLSILYLIKKNDTVFLVKQMKNDFYYDIERDYGVSMFIDYLIDKLKISHILIPKVYYIPSHVKSSIKKYENEAAIVMTYFDNCYFNEEVILEMQINNIRKNGPEVTEEGLTNRHFDFFLLDVRYIFIVALDIFFGNIDRHENNLLFDKKNNIIMIDHGDCFRHPVLGEKIINFLKLKESLDKNKKSLLTSLIGHIYYFKSIFSSSDVQKPLYNFFEKHFKNHQELYQLGNRMELSKLFANIDEHYQKIDFLLDNHH